MPEPPSRDELYRWTPTRAAALPWLRTAVEGFRGIENPGGEAAEKWLKRSALPNDPETATYLLVGGGRVVAFFATCTAHVVVTRDDARATGASRSTVPAILIAWIGRDRDAPNGTGARVFDLALGVAREGARLVGARYLVADPYDSASEAFWMQDRFGFKRSEMDVGPHRYRRRRLWRPLFESRELP